MPALPPSVSVRGLWWVRALRVPTKWGTGTSVLLVRPVQTTNPAPLSRPHFGPRKSHLPHQSRHGQTVTANHYTAPFLISSPAFASVFVISQLVFRDLNFHRYRRRPPETHRHAHSIARLKPQSCTDPGARLLRSTHKGTQSFTSPLFHRRFPLSSPTYPANVCTAWSLLLPCLFIVLCLSSSASPWLPLALLCYLSLLFCLSFCFFSLCWCARRSRRLPSLPMLVDLWLLCSLEHGVRLVDSPASHPHRCATSFSPLGRAASPAEPSSLSKCVER